ncbi:Retrovirus-related Pol polyprotein from transposon TNT 1-94 [Senna tora]|uniref:Retrovirus-related Pol polyprotein from transposon TNT 1-94 n=1 Tax=Senna tora TaxID=362788 RepID=A0A834THR9_9FABA|nr:Retrovirus-related Pol polyprotein from transposon TNT 1-94 [Senna tora]
MAANGGSLNVTQPLIPIFKGDSYEFWSTKMMTLFKSQDLWDHVEHGYTSQMRKNAGIRKSKQVMLRRTKNKRHYLWLMKKSKCGVVLEQRLFKSYDCLLSVGKLISSGYSVLFDDSSCIVRDKKSGQTIVNVKMTANKMFPLETNALENHALVASSQKNESKLWHLSRMSWVYFFSDKSKAFDNFRKFKALVKKQSGKYIKTIRTNKGGEFLSTEFNNFCEDNDIRKDLTAPYTPEQNGVAE